MTSHISPRMASDIVEEFSRGVYQGVTDPGVSSEVSDLHGAASIRMLQAFAELGDLSFACKNLQEENSKLKEDVENLRSLRMSLTRLHNEETRRANVASTALCNLKENLDDRTAQVARLEAHQRGLQEESDRLRESLEAYREQLSRLGTELKDAQEKAASVDTIIAERDNAKDLLNDSFAAQAATNFELAAQKALYTESVEYFTQSIGESNRMVMRSCRNEFYKVFPSKSWPGRKMVRAVLKGLNRYNAGVPDPVDDDQEIVFRDADRLEQEVTVEDAKYIAAERRKHGLPPLNPDGSEVQPPEPMPPSDEPGSSSHLAKSADKGKGVAP